MLGRFFDDEPPDGSLHRLRSSLSALSAKVGPGLLGLAALFAQACSGARSAEPEAPALAAEPPAPEPTLHTTPPRQVEPVADARLQELFEPGRIEGTMAVYDTGDGVVRCGDLERCNHGYLPASTFKIAQTLIAVENGVIASAEMALRWDGQTYTVEAWNQDHTVRSAFRASCVPCFQQVAREIGEARMRDWLVRLDYGNQQSAGSIDRFWLGGPLRITPLEQIDFLWRLDTGALPVRQAAAELARDVMEIETRGDMVLRGKTGWAAPPDAAREIAWFVGWVELGQRRVFFATLIDEHGPDLDLAAARREITERGLRAVGVEL